jgi:hypothetical protein
MVDTRVDTSTNSTRIRTRRAARRAAHAARTPRARTSSGRASGAGSASSCTTPARQPLDDNPWRDRGGGYCCSACSSSGASGRARLFVNAENLGNVRQTRWDPLVRPARRGRRPMDGRRLGPARRPGRQRRRAHVVLIHSFSRGARLPPSLKLRRTTEAWAEVVSRASAERTWGTPSGVPFVAVAYVGHAFRRAVVPRAVLSNAMQG